MFSEFYYRYSSPRLLVVAAVIPALFLMYYIYRHDRIEKEPGRLLARLVLFGILSAVTAGLIEALFEYFVFPQIPFSSVTAEIIALATSAFERQFGCQSTGTQGLDTIGGLAVEGIFADDLN